MVEIASFGRAKGRIDVQGEQGCASPTTSSFCYRDPLALPRGFGIRGQTISNYSDWTQTLLDLESRNGKIRWRFRNTKDLVLFFSIKRLRALSFSVCLEVYCVLVAFLTLLSAIHAILSEDFLDCSWKQWHWSTHSPASGALMPLACTQSSMAMATQQCNSSTLSPPTSPSCPQTSLRTPCHQLSQSPLVQET
jgi:hypothetical protein